MSNPIIQSNLELIQDPKFYLENFCKIKTKTGGLSPFILNEAQKDLFNTIRTSNRVIINKARQIGFCLTPSTKVLCNNLEWKTLDDIKVGEEIVSVEEFSNGTRGRKMVKAVIEAKWDVYEEAFKIMLSDGRTLIATGMHKFLSKKNGATDTLWRTVNDTKIGNEIRSITTPWTEPDYEDGWFAGVIDGEGHLSKSTRSGAQLTISQVEGFVLNRLREYVRRKGFTFREEWDKRTSGDSKLGDKPVCKIVLSKLDELFQIFGKLKPSRMRKDWWVNKTLPNNGWVKVVGIESLGKQRMVDLQTSSKTFIAEGFVSHNSTAVTGFLYHKTIMTPGVTTAIVGYNSDLTAELLDKIKTFYRTTPDELKPTIHYNSKFEISFPKIDSKILVLPSTENVGRGYTLNFALLTELAFWEKAEEKMMAIENSIPISGQIVIESTPNGVGNIYHKMCMSDNDYVKKEYGWWWLYTEQEIEQIRKRMNNPQKFAQEYSLQFLSSGRSVFDSEVINKQSQNILVVGDKVKLEDGTIHIVNEEEGFRIYKPPAPGKFYVFGVDVAEGVTGGDYSTVTVWDRANGEEVGFYRGHIAPDKFSNLLNKWGRKYNNALMTVEVNNHGLTTITVLKQLLYPSMYFRPAKFESIGSPWSEKLGWKTNKVTRPLLIDDFAQAVRDGLLTIHSKELINELVTFVYNNNNDMIAQDGYHDDLIFSAAIGFQGFKIMYDKPMNQLDYNNHMPASGGY